MDLSLNETQTMLQNTANELMEAELPKSRVLEIDNSPSGFSADLWKSISSLGWPGMVIPEEYGGSGNCFTDLGVVYEVMGYHACPSPHLSSAVLCAHAVLEAGDDAQKRALLPPIASGDQTFAFAFTEPEYGWGPEAVRLRAIRRRGAFFLNGTKLFVPDANVANQLLVVARSSRGTSPQEGLTLFVVDKDAPGVSVRVLSGWMGPKMCEVNFEDVEVPASNVLGPSDGAWPAVERAVDRATALLAPIWREELRRCMRWHGTTAKLALPSACL